MTSDEQWMRRAIELARKCPPSETAFSVGAVIVDESGNVLSEGYSRETDQHVHAEESALAKLDADDPRLATATLYSTLEPCTERKSRPSPCTQLILAAGVPNVVIAWREPSLFVADCTGVETLRDADVRVTEMPEMAAQARAVNSHLH